MEYKVQRGDTIAQVTQQLRTGWKTLRRLNPGAVGRSGANGNWFLREGAVVTTGSSFEAALREAEEPRQTGKPEQQRIAGGTPALQAAALQDNVLHYTVQPGDTLWELAVKRYHVNLDDIVRDNNISDPDKLRVGQELEIRLPEKTGEQEVVASWYGEEHHGRPMANGEPFNMFADTIAHRDIPLGTRVELENPRTGERVRAVVSDRGPYIGGRDVDLSYGLAKKLSLLASGVGRLIMRVL